jgi:hypothetical protein
MDLLQINCHVLRGGNHNPMLVERLNCYLNKGLRIMANERDSNRITLEAIHLLIYYSFQINHFFFGSDSY